MCYDHVPSHDRQGVIVSKLATDGGIQVELVELDRPNLRPFVVLTVVTQFVAETINERIGKGKNAVTATQGHHTCAYRDASGRRQCQLLGHWKALHLWRLEALVRVDE